MFSFGRPLKPFCYPGTIKCFIFNFDFLFGKCYIIESRKISRNRLYAAFTSCSLVTESQSTSDNVCLNSWKASIFIFCCFINISALCQMGHISLDFWVSLSYWSLCFFPKWKIQPELSLIKYLVLRCPCSRCQYQEYF